MSLEIGKVRANTHDPFASRTRSAIYADHMARWRPESRYRAILKAIGHVLRRRNLLSQIALRRIITSR